MGRIRKGDRFSARDDGATGTIVSVLGATYVLVFYDSDPATERVAPIKALCPLSAGINGLFEKENV